MSRKRNIQLIFWVSEKERELIAQKMEQVGTENLSAYLRKIAIDGFIIKLDLPELREMISLLRRSSNNLNQLARKANAGGFHDERWDCKVAVARIHELITKIGI